ncbi:MAG: hypothetical protein ACKVOU_09155 [Cytophagales bacterium]
MAQINNKSYDKTITRLEAMADGAKLHKDNVKVNSNIVETDYRKAKAELEAARQSYINLETSARKAYDTFATLYDSTALKLASDTRIIKGVMGRSAEDLKDFGVDPEKSTQGKKVIAKAKI